MANYHIVFYYTQCPDFFIDWIFIVQFVFGVFLPASGQKILTGA